MFRKLVKKFRTQESSGASPKKALQPPIASKEPEKKRLNFITSDQYWEDRYLQGRNSGAGSYGRLAKFKAEVLNEFVTQNQIQSVVEFGSGDGNQLSLAKYPEYLGVDVSQTAVDTCRKKFSQDLAKTFVNTQEYDGKKAEMALSLDVIYHLTEDRTFETYMEILFNAATRFVIVYSSNMDKPTKSKHVKHRRFVDWVITNRPDYKEPAHIPNRFPFDAYDSRNTSHADFYIFKRIH